MKKLALTLSLLGANASLFAQDLIQVVTEDLRPFNYLENGKIVGSSTAMVRKVLQEAKVEANFQLHPWARSYAMAQRDENTLIYTINRTSARETKFKWIGLLGAEDNDTFFFKLAANNKIQAQTLEQAKQYSIGVSLHDVNHEILKSEGFNRIHAVSQFNQSVQMLLRDRIDLIVGSYPVLLEACNQLDISVDEIEAVTSFRASRPYMAMSKSTPEKMANRLKASYQKLVSMGEIPDFEAQITAVE